LELSTSLEYICFFNSKILRLTLVISHLILIGISLALVWISYNYKLLQPENNTNIKLLIAHISLGIINLSILFWDLYSHYKINPSWQISLSAVSFFFYSSYLRVFLKNEKWTLKNFKLDGVILSCLLLSYWFIFIFIHQGNFIIDDTKIIFSTRLDSPSLYLKFYIAIGYLYFLVKSCYTAITFFSTHQSITKQFKLLRTGILTYLGLRVFLTLMIIPLKTNASIFFTSQSLAETLMVFSVGLMTLTTAFMIAYPITLSKIPKRFYLENYRDPSEVEDDIEQLYNQLNVCMIQDKLYLDRGMKINTLCQRSKIKLSEIRVSLNQKGFDNFNDYCNHFRLIAAEEQIKNGVLERLSMEQIYESAGFNSHQTFARSFRKKHGLTASDYWHKIKARNS
jgi:AraC-like DNA-binding protein